MEKLKKLQIKGFAVGFLIAIMASGTVVWANPGGVLREVFYGVNVSVNGQMQNFDADSMPFISDGRTFLPVRAISEALGVPVNWDGATSTVFVGVQPVGSPFWSTVPFFQRSGNNVTTGTVTSIGQSFSNAINIGGAYHSSGWSDHALNGQHRILTGTIGQVDGTDTNRDSIINFIGDGRELASFQIGGADHPRDISVDVSGVLVLRIEIIQPMSVFGNVNMVFLANAMIQ